MMLKFFLITTTFLFISQSVKIKADKYDNFKVFKIVPENLKQLELLESLYLTSKYDFWTKSRILNKSTVIMVQPNLAKKIYDFVKTHKFKYEEIVEDLGKSLDELSLRKSKATKSEIIFNINNYNSYQMIQLYLQSLQNNYPDKVEVLSIGTTVEGRNIYAIKIQKNQNLNKPAILIEAGIHAREWIGPATTIYLIHQLLKNDNENLLENVDWYIVPLLNPDGYEYSQKSDRLWRKNRSQGMYCRGVDINRNFNFHWMEGGSSKNECSEIYAGSQPFSERESQTLRNFATENKDRIKLYISLHSFGSNILYPWNYTPETPKDETQLRQLAKNVQDAIMEVNGRKYNYGSSSRMLYIATGNSQDWMRGIAGVNYSFAIELPGGGLTGFDVPEDLIEDINKETFEGFKVFGFFVASTWH